MAPTSMMVRTGGTGLDHTVVADSSIWHTHEPQLCSCTFKKLLGQLIIMIKLYDTQVCDVRMSLCGQNRVAILA